MNGQKQYFQPISKFTQINALLYKSFLLQFRQIKTNVFQILFPVLIMLSLVAVYQSMKSFPDSNGMSSSTSSGTSSNDFNLDNCSPYFNSYCVNPTIYYNNYSTSNPLSNKYFVVNPPKSSAPIGNNGTGIFIDIPQTSYVSSGGNILNFPYFEFFNQVDAPDEALVEFYKTNFKNATDSWKNWGLNISMEQVAPAYAIYVQNYQPTQLKLSYVIENYANSFNQMWSYYYINGISNEPGFRFTSLINNGFLQQIKNPSYNFIATMTPYALQQSFSIDMLIYFMAIFMLPTLFSFIFPVFVYNQVFEKQEKHTQILNMMGLTHLTYIAANLIYFFIIFLIISTFVVVIGLISGLAPIRVDFFRFALLVVLYGISLVAFSFFFSAFFWKTKLSTVISYLLMLTSPVVCVSIDLFGLQGNEPPKILYAYPPYTFVHGLLLMAIQQLDTSPNGIAYGYLTKLNQYSPLSEVYMALIIATIVYLIVGNYLGNVLPKEHGYSYPVLYPIYELAHFFKSKRYNSTPEETQSLIGKQSINNDDIDDVSFEDQDCKIERSKANSSDNYLLKAINLKKIYNSNGKVKEALFNFCLTSSEGEILGLLGPNGAGKTTFIHLLCGMYKPTSGEAYINGYKISNEMGYIYRFLSFCPQHDILYDDLTIENHLSFYYDLKGLYTNQNKKATDISLILQKVQLFEHRNKKVTELSGGQKRRVSISIALLGNSRLVLLDEPTTGLDPDARRSVWDIIESVKADKTILITTHNMQEADVLCSKIAIMSSGRLQCVGSPLYLKNKFGSGYTFDVVPVSDLYKTPITETIFQYFPNAKQVESQVDNALSFVISKNEDITVLFSVINQNKQQLGIKEWNFSQTSLEEVFFKMVENEEVR